MKKSYIMMASIAVLLVAAIATTGCTFPTPSPDHRGASSLTLLGCRTHAIPGSKTTVATPAGIKLTGQLTSAADGSGIPNREIVLYASNNYKPGIDFAHLKYVEVARATTDSSGYYQFKLTQRAAGYTYYGVVFGGDANGDYGYFKAAGPTILAKETLTTCVA